MRRDVNSSVSLLTVSCDAGASSSSASGGSLRVGHVGEERPLLFLHHALGLGRGRGRRHDDDRLALLVLLAQVLDDLLALGRGLLADPAVDRLPRGACGCAATRLSRPAPMRSITRSHEMPNSSDSPTASSASSSSVAPLKPKRARRRAPEHVAERAARRERQRDRRASTRAALRARRSRASRGRSPARGAQADARRFPRAARRGGSRRSPARRRRPPTTTPTRRTGRAGGRRSTRRPRRRDCRAARPCRRTTSRDRSRVYDARISAR